MKTGRGPEARVKSRDPHWDNMRFISGTLVLLTHLADTIDDREGLRWLYVGTWALRVPLFAIVAGYFSDAGPLRGREARRLAETVLVPYLVLGLLHSVQQWALDGYWWWYVTEPAWGTWFLLSLLFWRAALPWLARLRHPVTASVLVAMLAGYVGAFGGWLSLSRMLCFLPFFLLGWRIREGAFGAAWLGARWSRNAALAVLGSTLTLTWFARHDVRPQWLQMQAAYDDSYGLPATWDWAIRGGVLLCGAVVALSFVRLAPRRRLPYISYLGSGGLYIYLLHPLVIRPPLQWFGVQWVSSWWEQAGLVVLAVVLSGALASPLVRRVTWPFIQPRLIGRERRSPDRVA
jgi:fucose 4-O-acetylase-like acetyltransferase